MLNHYKSTETPARRVVGLMPLPRVAQGILSAPFRLAANATTRISKALAPWVATWRFLEGLDRHAFSIATVKAEQTRTPKRKTAES